MPSSDSHRVIVLAAGEGQRMGGPKALMPVAGVPWWRHQAQRLEATAARPLWIVSPRVREALEHAAAALEMADGDPASPMFASIRAGLDQMRDDPPDGVFVLPVDVPAPRPPVWRALSDAGGPAVPEHGGRTGHPVFMPWDWADRHLRAAPAGPGAPRLDRVIGPHARRVPVDDPDAIVNLNTPEDVHAWEMTR